MSHIIILKMTICDDIPTAVDRQSSHVVDSHRHGNAALPGIDLDGELKSIRKSLLKLVDTCAVPADPVSFCAICAMEELTNM